MTYIATDPQNLALGASIKSIFETMGANIEDILIKNNLNHIEDDKWYPQQDYLNVYNDLEASGHSVMSDLVSIGMKISEVAHFPPDVDTLEKALLSMDTYYKLNNQDTQGGWQVEIDGQTAMCKSTTPFPNDLEYGILYAMTRRFTKPGQNAVVKYQSMRMHEHTKTIHSPCIYIVTWE